MDIWVLRLVDMNFMCIAECKILLKFIVNYACEITAVHILHVKIIMNVITGTVQAINHGA